VLVDLGAVADDEAVSLALEQFLVSGRVSLVAVQEALRRHAQHGRSGVGALRRVLEGWTLGGRPPDSVLEVAMAALLIEHGLPLATFQHVVHDGELTARVDFAYPELRIAIEVDGWDPHGRRAVRERDLARDAELFARGWIVIRFTWTHVVRRPAWVARTIRRGLERRVGDLALHA
jgi:hypothetical protein